MTISGRIRPEQEFWLRYVSEQRFEGEMSRTLRWAIDQAQAFDSILRSPDPVRELDWLLNPPEHLDPEEEIAEAEREYEAWRREQAIRRAQRKAKEEQ